MLSVHSCPIGKLGTKDTGGMSVYILELARELGKRGHLVDVYTRAHNSGHEPVMELGQNVRLIHLRAGENEQVHKLAVYLHLPDFTCQMERFRRQNNLKYDLVFSHYWLSGWVGKSVQGWWNVPHVVMFHTLGAVKNELGVGENEPELRIETERYLVKNSDCIIASTKKEKNDVLRYYDASPESISVIPCGVNLSKFRPLEKSEARRHLGFADSDRVLLFVGRIEPLKGVDRLLSAIPLLKSRQDLSLVVVGGDEYSRDEVERLRNLCKKLKVEDSVSFLGLVEQERLPGFYSAADVCVIPSYYESFGLVALESLACGTPVVVTDVGAMKEIVRQGETGYVLPDNSPGSLAEKIGRLLSEHADSRRVNLARSSVVGFSWSNTADGLLNEFKRLVTNYKAG